jgi:enterochelin esterase-like enzyme
MTHRGLVVLVALVTMASCAGRGERHDRQGVAPGDETAGRGPAPCASGQGSQLADVVIVAGGREIRVTVYLPPGASASGRRYPALYLLHGAGADETQWPAIGLLDAADRMIDDGTIGPLIIVMPDLGAGSDDGAIVTDTIVPWAEAHLAVLPDRAHRAIGGISRGGGAALRLAATHPELFSKVGGHSPTVPAVEALPAALASWAGRIWLDVGTSDVLELGVAQLAHRLERFRAGSQLHLWDGGHDRAYWGAHVADYLAFYGTERGGEGCTPGRRAG